MLRFTVRSYCLLRKMSIFTYCRNPLTGLPAWEEKDENYDYHQEVARSAFADMLHDHERNEKYYVALKAAIEKKHQAGEEANVLDIGTGTGLLSMMAAKCGADTITACEAFTPMAKCAVKIIQENGFGDKIKLIHKRSTSMTVEKNGDMPKRANILVTEVFDTELIGEGALSTFAHAHEVLLEKNSIVVPHSATIWVQVVESSKVCAMNRIKKVKAGDKDLLDAPSSMKICPGTAAVHDIQLSQFPHHAFKPLLPPQPIFRFDWSGNTPLVYNEKVCLHLQPVSDGTAHAIFMWWDLHMDTEKKVLLSCAPVWEHPSTIELHKKGLSLSEISDLIPWRDHWMQAVYYFPVEMPITAGHELSLIGYHDEYSLWFQLINETIIDIPDCDRPACNCALHQSYCKPRIGQMNDESRNEKYIQALEKYVTPETVCLCLSDGSLLGLAIARLGAQKVFILETSAFSRRVIEMFSKTNNLSERVEIITSTDDLPPEDSINLIFGEPYFIGSIVPWENLRFWYLSSNYPSRIKRIPIAATIKGVAVEFRDLHKIRAPLGICEGFDLSSFDKLVQASSEKSDIPVEAQPLWEYPGKALTLPFVIKKFDLTQDVKECKNICTFETVPILESGSCNGVALWVDWHLDSESVITTGPLAEVLPGKRISWDPFTRQGVHLFRNISQVTKDDILSWSFKFVPENGEIEFDFSVSSRTQSNGM